MSQRPAGDHLGFRRERFLNRRPTVFAEIAKVGDRTPIRRLFQGNPIQTLDRFANAHCVGMRLLVA